MSRLRIDWLACLMILSLVGGWGRCEEGPRFRIQEFETGFRVGYAVLLTDINEDTKPDIVVVDARRVVWYENPTWRRHTILAGQTTRDNVCITTLDINRDGHQDLVLGADWGGLNTKSGGSLHWLERPSDPTQTWSLHRIGGEPTLHRIRAVDLEGDQKPEIVAVPLMGRDSSRQANWLDGRPVRILAYPIPADPVRGPWHPKVLSQSLHVTHNFWHVPAPNRKGMDLLVVSYEGVHRITQKQGQWHTQRIGRGNQDNPKRSRGASEIKQGQHQDGTLFLATIEPWHGHQVVVYTPPTDTRGLWNRFVVDDQLKWGHAVWCADLDGDGGDELIVGVRDDRAKQPGLRRGVRIYQATDADPRKWRRTLVDQGGVAVEDLAAADLNGDGRVDIVAVGRQTGNGRIYWNLGE